MRDLLKASIVTKDLIERRDLVKRIYGAEYAAKIETPKALLRSVAARKGIPVIAACLEVAQKAIADGHGEAVNPLIAAAVDLVEAGKGMP